jgi:hypothetical protein
MFYSNALNAHPLSSCTPCKIEIYNGKNQPLDAFVIALTLTLRNWTLHMTTKPSNRMIHVHDMLALETKSREVSHAANSHISGLLGTIRTWHANDLHAHCTARKVRAASRAA